MPTIKILSMLAFFLCANAAAQQTIDMNNLSETDITMLDLSKPAAAGKTFVAATIINAPVPKLCAILLDYSGYPDFMPNTDKAKASRVSDDSSLVDMTLKLPLGKIKKYRLKMDSRTSPKMCQLSWKLVPWEGLKTEETIADTSGYWQLTPHPSQSGKTLVKYFVFTDPGPVPIGLGWIVDSLSKDSIPKTLEALRARVLTR